MMFSDIKLVLGPTNTGKTFYAVDRMIGHASGMIGFPLRLLARENYDKLVAKLGAGQVALITGEEKIVPPHARYFCCTVEAMPLERDVDCLVIDEVQLAGDRERGHIFTDRLLHARGRQETLFLGAETMRRLLKKLFPDAELIRRPRLSRLSWAGSKKVTRLQRRSAIVAFSAADVYRLAELVRRQRGGAAVVMGALSPRTRNAQVELYQNGDVDFLIATDAIGMGLNMDISHVALAQDVKFDGRHMRHLSASEIAQIAGRAGRHVTDGTFGVTEEARVLEPEMIDAIESHIFPAVHTLYWRSRNLDFSTMRALTRSFEAQPPHSFMSRKADAVDQLTMQALCERSEIAALANSPSRIRLLWDVAQIPDFRNTMTDSHVVMLAHIFDSLARTGVLATEWVANQMQHLDRIDGDIDTLMTRIAHIRTWTYITHKNGWTEAGQNWQDLAKSIEDRLSDELHNRLTQRFVDRRAAHLSRKLKESTVLMTSVKLDGTVLVEGEDVGSLHGFTFTPSLSETDEKAVILSAARKGLPDEIERRVFALSQSADPAFVLTESGRIMWREAEIGRLYPSELVYAPRVDAVDSDLLTSEQKARIHDRLVRFMSDHISTVLEPLLALSRPDEVSLPAEAKPDPNINAPKITPEITPEIESEITADKTAAPAKTASPELESEKLAPAAVQPARLSGVARGILYQMYEKFGTVTRADIASAIKDMQETDKPHLARLGVRTGMEAFFMPDMLKPAPIKLRVLLYSLFTKTFPECGPPPEGRVSFDAVEGVDDGYWMVAGYRRLGQRVMRVDMVERVAALVRNAARAGQFKITDEMLSLAGVSRDQMALMLSDLGCRQAGEEPSDDPEKPALALFERVRTKRPAHKPRHADGAAGAPHKDKKRNPKKGKSSGGQPAAKGQRNSGSRPPEKQPDPNSPFAVLAALKK